MVLLSDGCCSLCKDCSLDTTRKKLVNFSKIAREFELNVKRGSFVLTDNIFDVLAREILDMVGALQLLYAKNDACLDDTIPLSFAEVL